MDPRCPRPDKLAFDTEEAAAERYKSLLLTNPEMSTYLCACGKWHAGRHKDNVERNAIANVPTITTGLNPVVQLADRSQRRRQRREVHRPSAVRTLTVDKQIWKAALAQAEGDSSRIEVIGETNVRIHNNGNWRKRRKSA